KGGRPVPGPPASGSTPGARTPGSGAWRPGSRPVRIRHPGSQGSVRDWLPLSTADTAGTGFQMPLRHRIARAARRDHVPRPPGPVRGVPGAALAAMRRDPLGMLLAIARDYGDIAYVRLGPFDVYIVSHPD